MYEVHRTDALRGVKLLPDTEHRGVRFRVMTQEAIDWP